MIPTARPVLGAMFGAALLTGLGLASAASAAVSEWAVSDGGRMRIAALSNGKGGYDAMLDIDLKPGWKTYWQNPGDAGLPPIIDLSGSDNVTLADTRFPTPEIGEDDGGRFIGYHAPVGVLMSLKSTDANRPAMLKTTIMIGVCKDICLPFQAAFELPLDAKAGPAADEFMKMALAKSELPEAPSPDFGVSSYRQSADGTSLDITLKLPSNAEPEIALGPSPGLAFGALDMTPGMDGDVTVTLPIKRRPKSGQASVAVLVKCGPRAMQTSLALE